jgi:uncharacterized protein (TIGR03435 family)
MPKTLTTAVLVLLTFAAAAAQVQDQPPARPDDGATLGSTVNPLAFDAIPAKVNFDIVSFKPCAPGTRGSTKIDMPMDGDYIAYHCENISRLIYFAYWGSVNPYTVASGYPTWLDDEYYDFTAKIAPEDIAAWQKLDLTRRRVVMRSLLADALKLKMKIVSTPEQVYLLTVAKGGAKLTAYKDGDQTKLPDGRTQAPGRVANSIGVISYFQDESMALFAEVLTAHYDRRVIDRTGLKGGFNFSAVLLPGAGNAPADHRPTDDTPSTIESLAAIGLRLEGAKTSVDRLAIEHVQRPETN